MNGGIAAAISTASAIGENAASSPPRPISVTMLWPSSNVCDTSDSGRDEASRRARVSLS